MTTGATSGPFSDRADAVLASTFGAAASDWRSPDAPVAVPAENVVADDEVASMVGVRIGPPGARGPPLPTTVPPFTVGENTTASSGASIHPSGPVSWTRRFARSSARAASRSASVAAVRRSSASERRTRRSPSPSRRTSEATANPTRPAGVAPSPNGAQLRSSRVISAPSPSAESATGAAQTRGDGGGAAGVRRSAIAAASSIAFQWTVPSPRSAMKSGVSGRPAATKSRNSRGSTFHTSPQFGDRDTYPCRNHLSIDEVPGWSSSSYWPMA